VNVIVTNAFQPPAAPELTAWLTGSNALVGWVSPAPGFVLQQAGTLTGGVNNWLDVTNAPMLAGESNLVTVAIAGTRTNQFYRARQR